MDSLLRGIKRLIPKKIFSSLQPLYHYSLARLGAVLYRFPSRHIKVVGITGTKGKTSTAELVNAVLEAAGYKTALAGTLRFKIGDSSEPNLFKMTTPGRFFLQRFLRKAVDESCDWAVLELTSEAAKQFRHKYIELDALIFTNLSPEHIESHGSFDNYKAAKLSIAEELAQSAKLNKAIISNTDDPSGEEFLSKAAARKFPYSIKSTSYHHASNEGVVFTWGGVQIKSNLKGIFNLYNMLAAATFAKAYGIGANLVKMAFEKLPGIKGRDEEIHAGQDFTVVVDYAHTPDSLSAIYSAYEGKRKICVLGSTGGGRDKWKRPQMGAIADAHCEEIILTDEDPYDEDPQQIVAGVAAGIRIHKPLIIMDRREAIRTALKRAQKGNVVLITGKGTDPYICVEDGKKIPWSDANVAVEELEKLHSA